MQITWARCGSNAASTPSWSLSAITPITPISGANWNESSSAAAVASAPCGLCAASSTIVGLRRTTSSRPGDVASANAARTSASSSGVLADERLDRGQRDDGVLGLVGAVQRQEHLVVPRAQPLQGHHLATHRGHPRDDPELQALPRHGRADLGRLPQQHLGRLR